MRPARIRLVDLGFDRDFDSSRAFAQSLIQSLVTRAGDNPVAEVEFIRTRDFLTVKTALQSPAAVIHLVAHNLAKLDDVGFWSDDEETAVSIIDLADDFAEDGHGIEAGVVFADACATAQGRFVRAIRDCIEGPITYIGATRAVDWRESTTFASAFYGAFFRDRGKGLTSAQRGYTAAQRASKGYEAIVAGRCPFKVVELEPSRQARRTLG